MLGVLLLGAQILLVSAAWRQSNINIEHTCSELLKTWNNEIIVSLYDTEGYIRVNAEYQSGGYIINVTFDGIEFSDEYLPDFDCFGVRWVTIGSTRRDGDEGRAEVNLGTVPEILIGGMFSSIEDFPRDKSLLRPLPWLMETAPLKYWPLTEDFWSSFNDGDISRRHWIEEMKIHVYEGNIPSQWVSYLTSGSLHALTLTGNDWRRPEKLLGYFPELWFLNLTDNNIEVLPKDIFSRAPSLRELYLSGNRLFHLPFGLENHQHLIEFHLENQRIGSVFHISDNDLPSLSMMSRITLRNVTLRIDLCNSSELVNLTEIKVVNSEILSGRKEEIYCTGSSESILSLKLGQNNLSVFPSNLIKRMINIINLDVRDNHLTDCQGHVLGILRKLIYLDMRNNRLRKLTADCFQRLEHLKTLVLRNNEIVLIEEGTFASLVNLSYLDLSGNKLVSIETGTFSGLMKLEHLDVSFNKLINIHYSIFLPVGIEELFQLLLLEKVDLSNNELSEVILWTQSMITITFFDLSNNSIRKIEVGNVESLNLSYNNLDHIPDGLVTIPENLTVDFGGNIIACCHPNNFMLAKSTVTIYNLGRSEPLYCVQNNRTIVLQSVLLNTSLCVTQESSFKVSVELWVSLGVFTAVAAVFMSFVYYYRTELAYLSLFAKILKRGIRTDEQKYDDAAYDAFVCYCGKNLAWIIKHLLHSVEGTDEGYRLCIHDRDFTLGAAIDTNVLTALDKSRKVIFVLSPAFMSSKWCRWELEMATHKMFEEERQYIILIELESLEGVVLAKQLKHLMKTRTYLHWPGDSASEDDTEKFWGRLRRALDQSIFCKTGRQLPQMTVLDIEE